MLFDVVCNCVFVDLNNPKDIACDDMGVWKWNVTQLMRKLSLY